MATAEEKVARFEELWRLGVATLRPEPIVFYKPKKSGDGVAAKFNLRLRPHWVPGEEYVSEVDGGLFVDLVAQGESNTAGFPTFKWTDKATLITAKLGLPDISGLLAAMRDFRDRGLEVPTYLRGKDKKPNVVSLFHTTDTSGSTGISYQFEPESAVLRVSKSKDKFKSVSLTLGEEVIFRHYLAIALDAYVRFGLR